MAILATGVVAVSLQAATVWGQEKSIAAAADRLKAASQETEKEQNIPNRVRETTWRLLMGELAARPNLSLSSGSYDALTQGLEDLDRIVKQLEADPNLERELAKDTQLTMRFDAAVARRNETAEKRDLSRASELERLKQMREINQAYRDLTRQLVLLNTELTMGRADQVQTLGAEALQTLTKVEEIAGRRRDYYLFQDEPPLAGDDAELKLIKELLAPVATDVRSHHQALRAMMLSRLAVLAPDTARQKLLEETGALAESAITGSTDPSVLALYAQAVGLRELGRLKTQNKPLSSQAHAEAAAQFQIARDTFAKAREKASQQQAAAILISELERQHQELESPDQILKDTMELTQAGRITEAIARLEFGLTVQRNESIVNALVEARLRTKTSPDELEAFLSQAVTEGAVKEGETTFQLLRGRVGVLGAWQQINDTNAEPRGDHWRKQCAAQLSRSQADLLNVLKSETDLIRWQAEAYLGLVEAGLLILDDKHPSADAVAIFKKLPISIDELTHAVGPASAAEKLRFQEAILAGRLAQGYLALRLAPDYRDSAQLAFAAAADVAASLPYSSKSTGVLGTPALQALWGREDAGNVRLAQEERFLRQALEKLLPAALALKFGTSQRAATSLEQVINELKQAQQTWSPQAVLDARSTQDAKADLFAQGQALAVLGLIGAEQPGLALCESLSKWYPNLTEGELAALAPDEIWKQVEQSTDPLFVFGLGLGLEEYATAKLSAGGNQCLNMLSLSRKLQDHAANLLDKSAGLRDRFPYLAEMIGTAQSRLGHPEFYLKQANQLRGDLRLTEARSILDAGTRRHPHARSLRDALIDTLIDEANLKPERSESLIRDALQRLDESLQADQSPPAATLLTLGTLRERTGSLSAAIEAYRRVLLAQPSSEQRLKAQSRLAVLKLKSAAT